MRMRNLLIGLGLGTVVGLAVGRNLPQEKIAPEKVLNMVKRKFKQSGDITGSWIYMRPEPLMRESLHDQVYHGGISRDIDGENVQYEFYADARTGTIIDVAKVNVNS
ncbi:PepSY domain-containing protein [Salinibacillus xinjiangensis]|nr:PepSY domain-containing protein [Salinibacillus xinjiangensis]